MHSINQCTWMRRVVVTLCTLAHSRVMWCHWTNEIDTSIWRVQCFDNDLRVWHARYIHRLGLFLGNSRYLSDTFRTHILKPSVLLQCQQNTIPFFLFFLYVQCECIAWTEKNMHHVRAPICQKVTYIFSLETFLERESVACGLRLLVFVSLLSINLSFP